MVGRRHHHLFSPRNKSDTLVLCIIYSTIFKKDKIRRWFERSGLLVDLSKTSKQNSSNKREHLMVEELHVKLDAFSFERY